MATVSINDLTFKSYLKRPETKGGARVELCTDQCGGYYAVKYLPIPKGQHYKDCNIIDHDGQPTHEALLNLQELGFSKNTLSLIQSTPGQTYGQTWIKTTYAYCHGGTLDSLMSSSIHAGHPPPEALIWHIIKEIIEYWYALADSGWDFSDFNPQHAMFFFPGRINTTASEPFVTSYPAVVFCGLNKLKKVQPGLSGTFLKPIRDLGKYFVTYATQVTANEKHQRYSVALLEWLKMLSGLDEGPPRYFDLHNLVQMLWTALDEYRGNLDDLQLSQWLSQYFAWNQFTRDSIFNLPIERQIGSSNPVPEMESWLKKGSQQSFMLNLSTNPPVVDEGDELIKTTKSLSRYLRGVAIYQGLPESEAVNIWPEDILPTAENLERMRKTFSNLMHGSLDRSIKLAIWSGNWGVDSRRAIGKLPKTRFLFDQVECNILNQLIKALGYIQEKLLVSARESLDETRTNSAYGQSPSQAVNMEDLYRLMNEAMIRYRNTSVSAYNVWSRWWHHFRETRSTLGLQTELKQWENWFKIRMDVYHKATAIALNADTYRMEDLENSLKLELNLPLEVPLDKLEEDRIVAKPDRSDDVFPRDGDGYTYRISKWGEKPIDQVIRHDKLKASSPNTWGSFLQGVRLNAVDTAKKDEHSPKSDGSSTRQSPRYGVAKDTIYAEDEENENRTKARHPRVAPRKRANISKNEYRVFKMYKNWRKHYNTSRGNAWYTAAGLWENYRQHFLRMSRSFNELKESFNRRGADTTYARLDSKITNPKEALAHIGAGLRDYSPKKDIEQLSLASSTSDKSLPVEEKPETWDVSDSDGMEDKWGRWVSKPKKNKKQRRRPGFKASKRKDEGSQSDSRST